MGTYRDVELERSHPLAETIATLRRERLYERVLLRGLPIEEVKAFIEAVGGQETPGEFADLIFRETEGNPFFVAEILRHLVETGAIRHEGDSWIGTPESVAENLPEGVREVIGRRLDGLSETCNKALAIAASMPGGFTVDVVGDVADLDEDTMLDVLDEALAAQVVRERRERPGHLRVQPRAHPPDPLRRAQHTPTGAHAPSRGRRPRSALRRLDRRPPV